MELERRTQTMGKWGYTRSPSESGYRFDFAPAVTPTLGTVYLYLFRRL